MSNRLAQSLKMSASLLFAFVAAALALSACGDDAGDLKSASEGMPAGRSDVSLHERGWLNIQDGVDPAVWLASRAEGQVVPESDRAVDEIRSLLRASTARFQEPERMIANRSAQLGEMLYEIGIEERTTDLISSFNSVVAPIGPKVSFGTAAQHYYNLRKSGAAQEAALSKLKEEFERRFRN